MGDFPHRRLNLLTGEWVLVSPHRAQRPWQGQVEAPTAENLPAYDPECYLCPGNVRANGHKNPPYSGPFVFSNDFPALLHGSEAQGDNPLFVKRPVRGECRVICYSPQHHRTLADLSVEEIHQVVETWCQQIQELAQKWKWVQVFENKGAAMGCSNPHPHGQIWASDNVPTLVVREAERQAEHYDRHGAPLLEQVAQEELKQGARVVEENESWVWVVPFWAVWPFETLLLPKRPVSRLEECDASERLSLATILSAGVQRYDRLFGVSFPYSMGWHFAPFGEDASQHWVAHAHFYPPLLRSAAVRKFMVGYEMLAEPQRDLTPEQAAQILRDA